MKKLMKPIALLFVIAVSTGAYAQQDKPSRPIEAPIKMKPATAVKHKAVKSDATKTKAIVVANREADIKRIIRKQGGLISADVK